MEVDVKVWFPPYDYDTRGNRLVRSRLMKHEATGNGRVYLCCCDTVAWHVEVAVGQQNFERLDMPEDMKRKYTHRLGVSGKVTQEIRTLLGLLEEVLTLEVPDVIDCAIALDFYKDPDPDVDPMQWKNTDAGQLVYAGKYWGDVASRKRLIEGLSDVILRHPLYAGAGVVVTVPGHNAAVTSFGERVANGVAAKVGKSLVRTKAANAQRVAAKQADDDPTPRDLAGEFTVGPEVHGRVVIIIDDVYRTGTTMAAVAQAARDAGAVAVLGLVGARTMRR